MFQSNRSILGFDGSYKRQLVQDFSRVKHESRESILENSRIERIKRADERDKIEKCKKIQAFIRGCLSRKRSRRYIREEFDSYITIATEKNEIVQPSNFFRMVLCFNYFYRPTSKAYTATDKEKLMKLCKLLIFNSQAMTNYRSLFNQMDTQTAHIVSKMIFKLSESFLTYDRRNINSNKTEVGTLLRALEVVLSPCIDMSNVQSTNGNNISFVFYIMNRLLRQGFIKHLFHYINEQEIASGGLTRLTTEDVPSYVRRPSVDGVLHLLMIPLQTIQSVASEDSQYMAILHPYFLQCFFPTFSVTSSSLFALHSEVASACCKYLLMRQIPPQVLVNQLHSFLNNPSTKANLNITNERSKQGMDLLRFIVHDLCKLVVSSSTVSHLQEYMILVASALDQLRIESTTTVNESLKPPARYFRSQITDNEDDEFSSDNGIHSHKMEIDENQDEETFEHDNINQIDTQNDHMDILDTLLENFGPLLSRMVQEKQTNINEGIAIVCHVLFALLVIHNQRAENVLRLGLCRSEVVSNVWQRLLQLLRRVSSQNISLFGSFSSTSSDGDIITFIRTLTPQLFASAIKQPHGKDSAAASSLLHALVTWSFLYYYHLLTMEEAEFDLQLQQDSSQFVLITTILKTSLYSLVQLMHSNLIKKYVSQSNDGYRLLFQWRRVFLILQRAFVQLHHRSRRHKVSLENYWLLDGMKKFNLTPQHLCKHDVGYLSPANIYKDPKYDVISSENAIKMCLLTEIPFVIPFDDRLQLLQTIILESRREEQSHVNLPSRNDIIISINRARIFEDAYSELSPMNVSNLRHRLRVEFVNEAGLQEAGVDGGGLTREFLTAVIQTAFDPNRGLFVTTERQRRLYPNPAATVLYADGLASHYYHFVGRVLAKCIYESHLVELPLADFFLAKLLSCTNSVRDVGYLHDLDPDFCGHLMSLKHQDPTHLSLDFTVVIDLFGHSETKELKPGGSETLVNEENKLEYIYLMTDYKLNKQLQSQTAAFKAGLSDVLEMEWLQMFTPAELRMVISGSDAPIDLNDWKSNCVVQGDASNTAVQNFWKVVESFTEEERRQLLYFVTSCSRPPMFGFRNLHPPFTIQVIDPDIHSLVHNNSMSPDVASPQSASISTARLPTVNTCMNLLKLPDYGNLEVLKEKLRRAINANAGFELS